MGRQQDGLVVAFKVMARIVPFKIYLLRQVQGSGSLLRRHVGQ